MDELKDQFTAILMVIIFLALLGFAGWLTDEDEPVKYQIQQRWIGDNTKGVRT